MKQDIEDLDYIIRISREDIINTITWWEGVLESDDDDDEVNWNEVVRGELASYSDENLLVYFKATILLPANIEVEIIKTEDVKRFAPGIVPDPRGNDKDYLCWLCGTPIISDPKKEFFEGTISPIVKHAHSHSDFIEEFIEYKRRDLMVEIERLSEEEQLKLFSQNTINHPSFPVCPQARAALFEE